MKSHKSQRGESELPGWCCTMFVVNIIWLVFTSAWFLHGPLKQNLTVYGVFTFLLVVVGITANVLLLKLRPRGVPLGFVTLGLVATTVLVQLWIHMGDGIYIITAVWRVIYNLVFLLAILKARTVIESQKIKTTKNNRTPKNNTVFRLKRFIAGVLVASVPAGFAFFYYSYRGETNRDSLLGWPAVFVFLDDYISRGGINRAALFGCIAFIFIIIIGVLGAISGDNFSKGLKKIHDLFFDSD